MSKALTLGLLRPQYVALPETFASALAWSRFTNEMESASNTGLRYRTDDSGSRNLRYRATAPQEDDAFQEFGDALAAAGVRFEGSRLLLGQAVANSVRGLTALKGSSQAASPLTPSVALLQDPRGTIGVKNPPDIASILEQMFALGCEPGSPTFGVVDLWIAAHEARLRQHPLLNAIDTAVDRTLVPQKRPRSLDSERFGTQRALASEIGLRTPFAWFNRAWRTLMREEWTRALPDRVWVDWTTTVLRLAYGLGYLWESAWYESLGRMIVGGASRGESRGEVAQTVHQVIPWRSSQLGIQARDVAPALVKRSHRADRIRKILEAAAPEIGDFGDALEQASADSGVRDQLNEVFRSDTRTSPGKNLWEASRYALLTRATGGSSPDYYGLLSSRGRFLYPEPGTEWVAVVASLACGSPGEQATVANVIWEMDDMGCRPDLGELVRLLERSGLARGSADADQAVLVQSAF